MADTTDILPLVAVPRNNASSPAQAAIRVPTAVKRPGRLVQNDDPRLAMSGALQQVRKSCRNFSEPVSEMTRKMSTCDGASRQSNPFWVSPTPGRRFPASL